MEASRSAIRTSCQINPTTLGRAYSERGINDNNKGDSAGFAGHGNQCPGRERFFIAAIIRPQYLVPAESVPTEASLLLAMYAAARTIPLALFALEAIYKQATPALLILGALVGAIQLLDAGIGLFEEGQQSPESFRIPAT